ncbi:MAG: hypothetical protein AB1324_07715 [Candidatus Micrarchaeota archaeon]
MKRGGTTPKKGAGNPNHETPPSARSGLPEELLKIHAAERARLEEKADAYKAAALSANELAERLKLDSSRKQLEIERMSGELRALSERPPQGEGRKEDAPPAFLRYCYRVAFAAMLAACALVAYRGFGRPSVPGTPAARSEAPAITASSPETPGPRTPLRISDEAGFRNLLESRYREVPAAIRMSAFTPVDMQLVGDYFSHDFADSFFRERSPVIFVSSADDVRRACARNEASGCYFPGSNASIMASGESQHTRLHELVHFMEWAYTGGRLTYVERGEARTIEIPTRLQEGMTELVTMNILGRRATGVAYPIEARIASMIERAGGASVLNRAFFSGDWRDAQESVNRRLGEFTFERLLMLLGTDDPGNIRAGDYSDPFACQPMTYLMDKMRADVVLRRELASMQRSDTIWIRSQDYCR